MRAPSSVASSPCRPSRCEALRGTVVARGPGQPRGEESLAEVSYTCGRRASKEEEAMMDRERPNASDSEGKIPEAWIGQEVMIETTETLSSDLRASAPVYLEDVNDRAWLCWLRATAIKTSSPATSTPGAWLAGYALPRRTSGRRSRELRAPPRHHAIHQTL